MQSFEKGCADSEDVDGSIQSSSSRAVLIRKIEIDQPKAFHQGMRGLSRYIASFITGCANSPNPYLS